MKTVVALAVQPMMGISLVACAGLRAWQPILAIGLLARGGYAQLRPSFPFLTRDDALTVFGVAAVLEFLGDKFIVIDYFLFLKNRRELRVYACVG